MMLLLLLLWCIPREIFGIYCIYSSEPLELKLQDFNSEEFEQRIDEIGGYDYKDDNINMCRVEIYIEYRSDSLIISFADSYDWSELDDGEGRLDFLIMFNQSDSVGDYYNVLEYACYDQNQCEKLFLLNHIHWLKQINYRDFQKRITALLFSNSTPIENCFTDKTNLINCANGACSGKYSTYYNTYMFQCYQNAQTSVEVHITTTMIVQGISLQSKNLHEQQIIRYTCLFNQCNNQFLTDALSDIVRNFYPLSQMRDAFMAPYPSQQTHIPFLNISDLIALQTTTTTDKFASLETTSNEYLPSNIAKNSSFISIHLLFICLFLFFGI